MDDFEIVYDVEAAAGIIRVLLLSAAFATAADVVVDMIRRLMQKRG
jgi:hypothetical protein